MRIGYYVCIAVQILHVVFRPPFVGFCYHNIIIIPVCQHNSSKLRNIHPECNILHIYARSRSFPSACLTFGGVCGIFYVRQSKETATGNIGIIWIACAVLMLCFRKTRRTGITLAVALIFTVFLNNLTLKNLFARPRPFQVDPSIVLVIDPPGEFSFPSGHTLSSFAATTVIWHGLGKKYGIPALVWSCLIAFSRLYFRVHYVTDILGGMVIGTAVGALACLAVNIIQKKYIKKTNTKGE